ncbi:MAG: HNH endonuclease [Bacteroidales bacterium]|nr:HNH endonuclease [Bacteroidales bacterium]
MMKLSTVRGYRYFMWFKSDQGWKYKIKKIVHRLVAEAFIEPGRPEQNFVLHLDHDKGNNYYTNLRWATRNEMIEHNRTNPRVLEAQRKRKGRITNSKLTVEDVLELKRMVKKGDQKLYKIAEHFGITHTQLNRIRNGHNWAHVNLPEEES